MHQINTSKNFQIVGGGSSYCGFFLFYGFVIIIRSFVCNTKRPSVKQSMKWQVSSNLADEPTLADVLPPHLKLPEH